MIAIFEDQEKYIETVTGLMMGSIFITLIGSIFLRRRLLTKAMEVDKNAITPSDFGLIGKCPEFSDECDFSKEQIFNEVKEHFKSAYDVDDIEYVNVANDISNLF